MKNIKWWIVGIIFYSLISLFIVSISIIVIVLIVGNFDIALVIKVFNGISLLEWLAISQVIFASLLLTDLMIKTEEFFVKKSKLYQWIYFSNPGLSFLIMSAIMIMGAFLIWHIVKMFCWK